MKLLPRHWLCLIGLAAATAATPMTATATIHDADVVTTLEEPTGKVDDNLLNQLAASMDTHERLLTDNDAVLEGVTLPPHQTLADGTRVYRHGHGLRSFTFYGGMGSMKMYVAAVYSDRPLQTGFEMVGGPLLLQFTFLRKIPQKRVRFAWQTQLDWSVAKQYSNYPDYSKDRQAFVEMFGPMASYGTMQVQFLQRNKNDETAYQTLVFDQGELKGTIDGPDFQKAFLSMWFGDTPVEPGLKAALLGVPF